MQKIVMLTAVPTKVAEELTRKHRVTGYNTLPHINKRVLKAVKEFMSEHVGYEELPMACLSKPTKSAVGNSSSADIGLALSNYMPINSKDCILFQLEMADDLLISVSFSELLKVSKEVDAAFSEEEADFLCEEFKDSLTLGTLDEEDQISFIPFLDYDRCKFYACLDPNFNAGDVKLSGISKIDVRELASFF